MTSERRGPPTLCPGDLLERRYEIEAQVGAGGMARVFRARDVVTKGTVAIKLMDPDWEADPTKVARQGTSTGSGANGKTVIASDDPNEPSRTVVQRQQPKRNTRAKRKS